MNPEVVKSRYYQQKWEESCKIFLAVLEKMIVNSNCHQEFIIVENVEKLLRLEEDLWMNYYSFLITNSNYNQFESFDAYMYHTQQLQEQIDFAVKTEESEFNNYNIEQYLNCNYQYISQTEIISNNLFNPLAVYNKKEEYASLGMPIDLIETESKLIPYNQEFNNINSNENSNNQIIKIESPKQLSEKQPDIIKIESPKLKEEISDTIKETKKLIIPLLKEYNFKFTKRENIDKKILRKLRKFLKIKYKKQYINLNNNETIDNVFWNRFSMENLLPPMKYSSKEEQVEYKSFNTNFMIWLMSHRGSVELYNMYLSENFEEMINMLILKFNLKNSDELNELKVYIKNMACLFDLSNYENIDHLRSPNHKPKANSKSPRKHKFSEEVFSLNQKQPLLSQMDFIEDTVQDIPKSTINNCDIFDEVISQKVLEATIGK